MSSTALPMRPPGIHHEHSPWPQRYATLIGVVGLHALVGMALLAMKLSAPLSLEQPVLSVQWISPQQPTPEQAKAKEPPPKKLPDPVQKPVPVPKAKPVETPVIQAPATAVAEAPAAPAAPPQPPAPAPQPAVPQTAAPSTPVDRNLNVEVDCTQHPDPRYPQASKTLAEEGTVQLSFQVDERGRPLKVDIDKSSGYARLDRSARDNILENWICPIQQNKQRVAGRLHHAVTFVLVNH
ncbi:MAG TPA: TonB family protein [Rhodocyclaceae bacterium]|nr:TonB family protein [Rhodocyclaceae bacterium]